ncbi:MAG: ATP-grasp domain-containing protein, partial [Pseudomonadales bacterium]
YVYMTYGGHYDDPLTAIGNEKSAVILGGGAYRIGASVEFDWCAVSCSRRLQALGWKSVMINCNPETVSTDYNSCDRLYFDELSLERIMDVTAFETVNSVVACMGGQLPNQLAIPLSSSGLNILGHSAATIDAAENRSTFSALLDELQIDQPQWVSATSEKDIQNFVQAVGFPILIRPSYVLSGAAMNVAYNADSLAEFLGRAELISPDHPVVLSEFVVGAREIELDGVAQEGQLVHSTISEHIENAGVHSGDATVVVPAQRLYIETIRQVKKAARQIVERLNLNGPFNMQFLSRDGLLKVIECNVRAARSFPFVSKTIGLNLADLSTDILIGLPADPPKIDEDELPFVGVKSAMFSFTRLSGADPILGVEMAATGEVGCIADTFSEALLLSLRSSGIVAPRKGVLVSSGAEKDKLGFLESAEVLRKLNVPLFATHGTGSYLRDHGYDVTELGWIGEEEDDCLKAIKLGWVDLVINIPKSLRSDELTRGSRVRQAAARLGCPLMTNMQQVMAFMRAIDAHRELVRDHALRSLPAYLSHSSQVSAHVDREKPGYWQLLG